MQEKARTSITKGVLSIFIVFFLWTVCCSFYVAEPQYASRKLESLGKNIPQNCIPESDSVFSCANVIQSKNLIVAYNEQNQISHLGISLFSKEIKQLINEPVCNFIERMMLELALQKNAAALNKKMAEYNIQIEQKGVGYQSAKFQSVMPLLDKMATPIKFDHRQQEKTMTAVWTLSNGETISMTFPTSRELIFGTDKKESDEELYYHLPLSRCKTALKTTYSTDVQNVIASVNETGVFIERGKSFVLPQLNSNIYFQEKDGAMFAINNKEKPIESLHNLLVIGDINSSLNINVHHRMYGGFTPEFTIKLNDLICFFKEDFDIYCSVEEKKGNTIQATTVFHNKKFNYLHLLIISTDKNAIFEKSSIVQGDFYTNIPQDNIKNLFR